MMKIEIKKLVNKAVQLRDKFQKLVNLLGPRNPCSCEMRQNDHQGPCEYHSGIEKLTSFITMGQKLLNTTGPNFAKDVGVYIQRMKDEISWAEMMLARLPEGVRQ